MKNVAIIVAGGVGKRVGANIPKQFIKVFDKPILIYTLEAFEKHPLIDKIEVVCIESWIDELKRYIDFYKLNKIKYIIPGGNTVQESIRNGVFNLKDKIDKDDIVIVHDGIRPVVDSFVIDDVIKVSKEYGAAATSLPYNEQIFLKDNELSTIKYIPRETLMRVSTPQAYNFQKLYDAYKIAFKDQIGIYGSSYTNTMRVELGNRLYFSKGSDKNIKITTKDDILLFKAYIESQF